ncbi:molybdopterin molybdotransferase MoeA [Brooklawnia cerclae]|uniref:Molybdopterin molybdenumtransferase n=1 Tax=Brooklawnia cerclae TaxID=349934 RepID=A0ABX0SMJ3_9ACTN|nr:gephyrin-like molybdotransferase Glp [Brooklawnia cerclae]NIH57986.1 molybdopterin molybdotransferase [Brooklawnia cerclae]
MGLFKRRPAETTVVEPVEVAPAPVLPPPPPSDHAGRRVVGDQQKYLLSLVQPLPAFGMYLLDAWGTAVCEDIVADTFQPIDDLVAVDGYAVRSSDLEGADASSPITLRLRDDDRVAKVSAAVRVRSGQVLPEGADAVVPAGRAVLEGTVLTVERPVAPGDFVRRAGSEVRAGVPLMRSGERLDARRSALLAMAGVDRVLARPRPRVVVLSLADADSDPADVDSHLLAAAAKADGAQVWRVGLATGTDRELHDLISDQLIRADIVVATGALDGQAQLPRVVSTMGPTDMASVLMSPGGRIGFGLIGEDEIPMVMLPDDPVAAYADYQVFVRPLVRKLMGTPVVQREQVSCLVGGELSSSRGLFDLRFGTVREQSGEKVVVPIGRPDNPRLADLVAADAVVVLPEATTSVGLGERVGCWLLAD